MKNRLAFTMLELIFVIVIMGIIGKFGVEFLAQAYNNFIFSSINNTLQVQSEAAVEAVAAKLQFRIKNSIIGRQNGNFPVFNGVASIPAADSQNYNILEWVGSDIDGFRGNANPFWSGIIDIDISSPTILNSPMTNTGLINNLVQILSDGNTTVNDAAIYFIGSQHNIQTDYGWDGNPIVNQNAAIHPINNNGNPDEFVPVIGGTATANNFTGVDVFEYYQLAWTAYAVGIRNYDRGGTNTGTLMLYYDYQPWNGERYDVDAKSEILMENVSTFQFRAVGSVIKIQVCVNSEVMEDYSLCKEKTIF